MSDGLYAGLYLCGVAVLVDPVRRPTIGQAAARGALAALAYLVRPEGVGLAVVAALLLVGRGSSIRSDAGRRCSRRSRWRSLWRR